MTELFWEVWRTCFWKSERRDDSVGQGICCQAWWPSSIPGPHSRERELTWTIHICAVVCVYVCAWMCMCMFVRMYISVCVHACVCGVCARMDMCMFVCVHMHECMPMCVSRMCMCMHVCLSVCIHACLCVCITTHAHMCIHIINRLKKRGKRKRIKAESAWEPHPVELGSSLLAS